MEAGDGMLTFTHEAVGLAQPTDWPKAAAVALFMAISTSGAETQALSLRLRPGSSRVGNADFGTDAAQTGDTWNRSQHV